MNNTRKKKQQLMNRVKIRLHIEKADNTISIII